MSFKQKLKEKWEAEADPSKRNLNAEVELEAEKAQLQLSADKLATKSALLKAKSELESKRVAVPYDPNAIIILKQKVKSLEEGLTALDVLEAEDFPTAQ